MSCVTTASRCDGKVAVEQEELLEEPQDEDDTVHVQESSEARC